MALPKAYRDHMRAALYSPRSNKHSNALAEAIALDLLAASSKMQTAAEDGSLVYDLNFDLVSSSEWNVDLVLGRPPARTLPAGTIVAKAKPSTVEIAVEIKGVMTQHGKNIKNRKRDLESHHQHVHSYNSKTIAGGVLVINAAPTFFSPLRAGQITDHKNIIPTLLHCMIEAQAITVRSGADGPGLDAKAVIMVNNDNQNLASVDYYTKKPAPQVGNPMHYDSFIQRMAAEWESRFGR
jgi:hypothetical protein